MRKKLIIGVTAGALTLGGLAVAVPAVAASDTGADAAASAVERIRNALDGLVSDGTLTEEQADRVATTLRDAGLGGHGGGHRGGFPLATAAEALEMTEDELRTALEPEGTTLADVAEAQGVPLETLVGALVAAAEERVAQAVEDGRLTQEEADQRVADLEERITDRMTSALPDRPADGRGGPGGRGDAGGN
ncbi:hypothetical protein OF117_10940 [Geodermatophilus sp. YIM 151500]|uniref:hypothetical protein n=1 Tax=Geodermatophilus sp. YIM 151500 TaxID=2984531 RepID=UPI0021E4285F|nr:hypothetical protein [Geodermatophilus sp. YIM 151500]MCV2489878.1 hypothetical protein [Geodermatophilus sp. YIM 151500]